MFMPMTALSQSPPATSPVATQPAAISPADLSTLSAALSTSTPSTQPAEAVNVTNSTVVTADHPIVATAIKVEREVNYAVPGPDGLLEPFKPVRVGDRLPAGSVIRTGLRSKLVLTFGDNTVVLIDRVTLASIDRFVRQGDTQHLQLGLGHGLIRATTVETTLRSEMTIASPVATLSKRGTLDFGMRYLSGSNRYTVWLNDKGLVEAFDQRHQHHRSIQPGQYMTQAMLRWIEQLSLDRAVPVIDSWGLTDFERFSDASSNDRSAGVSNVGAGAGNFLAPFNASHSASVANSGGAAAGGLPPSTASNILQALGNQNRPGGLQVVRPEGNFGIGQGK